MRSFPSINQFRHAVEKISHVATYIGQSQDDKPMYDATRPKPTLIFTGAVKLHGTNAGIEFNLIDDNNYAQSRERVLSVENDHAGFCAWSRTESALVELLALKESILKCWAGETPVSVHAYGEWCGLTINAKTAIGKLPARWVLFGFLVILSDGAEHWIDPDAVLKEWRSKEIGRGLIYFINAFQKWEVVIDFNDPGASLVILEKLTLEVEARCPVGAAFGVSDIGEGIVWECTNSVYGRIVFKTKGDKHKGTKGAKLVTIAPEIVAGCDEFCQAVLTESRLEQGFEVIRSRHGKVTLDSIGEFLMWIGQDVMKEESDTLKASGLDRKVVMNMVNRRAKNWVVPLLAKF